MSMIIRSTGKLRTRAQQSASLLGNAGSLAAGSLSNAALGFAFWALAARSFSPQSVGNASAAVSLMSLASLIGEFGLGTLLLGEIQRNLSRAPRLISAVLVGALAMSFLSGLAAVAMCRSMSIGLGSILNTEASAALFVAACAAAGFALVLDGVLIGLLKSHRQMIRNLTMSVLKLALLAVVALTASRDHAEFAIFLTWAIGIFLSIGIVAAYTFYCGELAYIEPGFDDLKPLVAMALRHHALNVMTLAPAVALPFVVATTLSAEINAAFFAAWMLLGVVLMIPAALTTVLFTVGVKSPDTLAHQLGSSLGLSVVTGIGATVAFYLFGNFALALFNPAYPGLMGPSVQYLGLAVFAVTIKYHYIAIQRLNGDMLSASVLMSVCAFAELALAFAGAKIDGLTGLTVGWMIAVFIEALVMLPIVVAASPWGTAIDGPTGSVSVS